MGGIVVCWGEEWVRSQESGVRSWKKQREKRGAGGWGYGIRLCRSGGLEKSVCVTGRWGPREAGRSFLFTRESDTGIFWIRVQAGLLRAHYLLPSQHRRGQKPTLWP